MIFAGVVHQLTVIGGVLCAGRRRLRWLTPKGLRPIFCSFLKFGQAILVRVLMLNCLNLLY